MTLESANICSQLLTLGAGETTLLSRTGTPQDVAPTGLVAETNGLGSTAATITTNIAMCSFLHRNIFSWELAFGLGSSETWSEVGRARKWTPRKPRSVPTRSVRAWRRRASIAAPSVKQPRRRQRLLVRAHTQDAKARRASHRADLAGIMLQYCDAIIL